MPFWSRRPPEEPPSWEELFPLEALQLSVPLLDGLAGADDLLGFAEARVDVGNQGAARIAADVDILEAEEVSGAGHAGMP